MYNCKDCCFAKIENQKQVECLADKYKYLKCKDSEKNSADNFFELDRLCLYKRKHDWKKEDTNENRLEVARKQLFPNIGICLDDDSEDPDDLENIINKVINIDYPKNKIKVIIYSRFNKAGARIPVLLSKMRLQNINCWSVFVVDENFVTENETSVFKKLTEATFLAKLSSKTKVDLQKTVNKINEISNDELRPVLVFKNEDALFLSKSLVSRSYLDYLNYSKMEKAILNKVTNTEHLYNIT